jgi:ribokinase
LKPDPSASIVVLGSVNADLVMRCERLPRPGETVLGEDLRTLPGGKGANQAVAAARLGARVEFVGCVGADAFGQNARDALQREGVGTTYLRTLAGERTGAAVVLVEHSGQNSIAIAAGANARLSTAQVEAAAGAIQRASLLVCQLESPLPAVAHAIALAHRHGVPVVLNPAPAQALSPALLAQVDTLVPNEGEAAQLLGLAPGSTFDAAQAAQALRSRGPRTVIVTLGGEGVCIADANGIRRWAAPRVQPLDTTGAGDTFIGAYAAARCEGMSADDAIAFAQRAAAISVTREGAMVAMPTRAECEALQVPAA